ncbi:MAG: PD40 domain-containing protein [Anaerolineae bacterium]|nr:PD40 domain-containing protein [Gemmatimonadaceae bacterium]
MRSASKVAAGAVLLLSSISAHAQLLEPHARWRTLRTQHFSVHFTPQLEEAARRAAAEAERAYRALAVSLHPPRGPIDLVVADNVDFSNGSATPVPSNRIVVYGYPPLSAGSLRFYDDWLALVITHELVHIFHLDRARGWWRHGQRVFGRSPWLMPNLYAPGWVIEGLATYYESAVTDAGRVRGSHERMVVRASALEDDLPRIGDLSQATSRYPGGEISYAYGALFFDNLGRTRGASAIPEFIERTSGALLPYTLNSQARASFGTSLTRAFREWRDTLRAASESLDKPIAGWRELTRHGRVAFYPRWLDSSTLVYASSNGREMPGAYEVDTQGRERRIGRRNGVEANVPMYGGGLLFSQLDFVTPYRIRSDLYIERDGRTRRLTRGARLSEADARADGWIVAVRGTPASTQLVRVSPDGRTILPLVTAAIDTQWSEPRWSPAGDKIAVTRWTRGGYADIVIVDTLGGIISELTHDRAVDSSPSWTPDGKGILFSSDRTGVTEVYLADTDSIRTGAASIFLLSDAQTGLFYPSAGTDSSLLASVRFRSDGLHVGVSPFKELVGIPATAATQDAGSPAPVASDTSHAREYSPWRSLIPRFWTPLIGETATGGISVGAGVEGRDVVGRHAYAFEALLDFANSDHEGSAFYRYRGLGQPVIDAQISREWSRFAVTDTAGEGIGSLRRRAHIAELSATFNRPRTRTSMYATIGGELEYRDFRTEPFALLDRLDPVFSSSQELPGITALAGWSNVQRPTLAISNEDGISLAASTRVRWLRGESGIRSRSTTAAASLYKSVDFPGFAHHVLAGRAAIGISDGSLPGEFSVGGTSASSVSGIPGLSLGERRLFAVRGFPPGARFGRRALAGSAEYRAPLRRRSRGFGLWPFFLDRASLTLFADAGTAFDPGQGTFGRVPANSWLASVGAELNVDAALQYDIPYRFRLGIARPVVDNSMLRTRSLSVYLRAGTSF